MAKPVPNRANDPKRVVNVGKYTIEYGNNPFTGAPEAWSYPSEFPTTAKFLQSSASTLRPVFDSKGNDTGETYVSHGTRGTTEHPNKAVRKHIEKTLTKMGKK